MFTHMLLTSCITWAVICYSSLALPQYPLLGSWEPQEIDALLESEARFSAPQPLEDYEFNTDGLGLGTVSAVDVDSKGDLLILHRADRPWDGNTFTTGNVLTAEARAPISHDTIVRVSAIDASYISSFGKDFFNVPHGLKVDSNDNIWVTDVGRHQVFRFPHNSSVPDLTVGEQFVPGSDDTHLCQPADVVVASNGDFFVADGYCNSRVLKFSSDGRLLAQWGMPVTNGELTPFTLRIVHSITLIEKLDLVCVADRENQRALCYNAGLREGEAAGAFNRTLIPQGDIGPVFAIYYNSADDSVIATGVTAFRPYLQAGAVVYPARGYTYNLAGYQLAEWAYITPQTANYGPSEIHDLCASRDGRHYFLADLLQQRVVRFSQVGPLQ